MKKYWVLGAFCAAHIFIIGFLFNSSLYDHRYTASILYFDWANRIFQGLVPYRDFSVEYPPLAIIIALIPRLFTSNPFTYEIYFTAEIIAFDLAGLFLVCKVARLLKLPEWSSLGIYTLSLLATGPIVMLRYDLTPAIMMLGGLYAFFMGRNKTSWTMIALATMTKVYPAVVAPVLVIYQVMHRQYRRALTGCLTFGAVSLLCAYPFLLFARGEFIKSFTYHTGRELQIESTYASVLAFLHTLGLATFQLDFASGSWNAAGPLADAFSKLSTPIMLFLLALVYLVFALRQKGHRTGLLCDPDDFGAILNVSVLTVLVFISAGKVLSPQFILWIFPFVPLVSGKWRHPAWLVYVVIGLLTYYLFPPHYLELLLLRAVPVNILLLRNLLLIYLGVLLIADTRTGSGVSAEAGVKSPSKTL